MSIIGSANAFIAKNSRSQYKISRSLRFNSADSAYLNRTPASAGNRKTWTWSGWVKRAGLSNQYFFSVAPSSAQSDSNVFSCAFSSDNIGIGQWNFETLRTTAVYRDVSAWYHIVILCDTTQATAANRLRLFVNGLEVTAFSTDNRSSNAQNTDLGINAANPHSIGRNQNGANYYTDAYLTEINFIDGQALTPSSFGETDTITGVWKPKRYTGTYGTNGFYLNFSDNSGTTATTLGKDSSGNGNNWTPNNFSVTAGAGNDSMIDTPTPYADGGNGRGNYATLNPLDIYAGSLSNGNLEFSGLYSSQNGIGCRGTLAVPSSGKWYAEAAAVLISGVGNSTMLGFTSSNQSISATAFGATLTPWLGVDASINNNNLRLIWNGVSGGTASSTTLFATYASGDVVNFAIDFDNGKLWIGKNGTWYNSGNPAAGTNATTTFTAGTSPWRFWAEYVASADNSNRSGVISNFGQRVFAYTPPSGFLALNTQNLPDPTIKKPNQYFDISLWNGTGANQNIINSGFQPDLVWNKSRSNNASNVLTDAVRGAGLQLFSDSTSEELSIANQVTAFNSNGFTVGADTNGGTNFSGRTFVGWQWKEGATPGFDIVTFTSDGVTTGGTFAHALGVAPKMIIYKGRNTTENWYVYHADVGPNSALFLNLTNGSTATGAFNNTAPTSSVIQLKQSSWGAGNLVAYCFSEVAGFSKFGSYTGNGSSDGPFVYCGFRPRWVMAKATAGAEDWVMLDAARNTYNVMNERLYADTSTIPSPADLVDFTATGFKIRNNGTNDLNTSGRTYIFCAFAETPAKYSLAR